MAASSAPCPVHASPRGCESSMARSPFFLRHALQRPTHLEAGFRQVFADGRGGGGSEVVPGCHPCESSVSPVLSQNAHSSRGSSCSLPSWPSKPCAMVGLSPKQGVFCRGTWWAPLREAVHNAALSWACSWAEGRTYQATPHRSVLALLLGAVQGSQHTVRGENRAQGALGLQPAP